MKLTNGQIREAFSAFAFMNNSKLPCFVEVAMNFVELEGHAVKIEKFLMTLAEKNKWITEDKQSWAVPPEQMPSFNKQTKEFFAKQVEVSLEVIKKGDLKGNSVLLEGALITSLIRLKLIV